MQGFKITDAAAKKINDLVSQEMNNEELKLRISISGGGCSGFKYNYDFDKDIDSDDIVFNSLGARVIIDATSYELMLGSTLDYIETLGNAGFEIKNPKAVMRCGCGKSFCVTE